MVDFYGFHVWEYTIVRWMLWDFAGEHFSDRNGQPTFTGLTMIKDPGTHPRGWEYTDRNGAIFI